MLDKLMNMDRRVVFILVALAVIIPTKLQVNLPISVSEPTQQLYDYIDNLEAGSTIMIAFNYGPAGLPELHPMGKAVLKQCFDKGVRVIGVTLAPDAPTLANTLMEEIAQESRAVAGKDYVFLGYRPGGTLVMLGMGTSIADVFESDYNGTALAEIPIMENITNYDQISLLVDFASGATTEQWINYANTQYNLQVAAGVTGVIIAQMYPFLQTGQLVGLIAGIAGAAEYERLIDAPAKGMQWINIESFVHLLIVGLVILGNIAFFIRNRQEE